MQHEWNVEQDTQGYYVECECGWESTERRGDLDDAYGDGVQHEVDMDPQYTDEYEPGVFRRVEGIVMSVRTTWSRPQSPS